MAAIICSNCVTSSPNLLAASNSERVKARSAIRLSHLPFGLNPTLEKEALEGGIKRAFFHRQHIVGESFDGLGDAVAVKGGAGEGFEDEHVESAGKQIRFLHSSMYRLSMDRKSMEM